MGSNLLRQWEKLGLVSELEGPCMNVISIKKKKRNEFYLIWSVFFLIYNFYNFIYLFIKFQWSNKSLLFIYLFGKNKSLLLEVCFKKSRNCLNFFFI